MGSYLKVGENWVQASRIYIKTNGSWVQSTEDNFRTYISGKTFSYGGFDGGDHTLTIVAMASVSGETYELAALYDNRYIVTSACTWSIVNGGMYAVMGSGGTMLILTLANGSLVTVRAEYNGVYDERGIYVTYKSGTSAITETEVVVDESGNTTTTTTTIVENEDGSSSEETTIVITDESGNTIGSQESEVSTNADGSYTGTTTNYNENGDPVDTTNASGDTEGNVSTQGVTYDESGNSAVTSYVIDTTDNPDGEKTFSGNGVNTEYYAFDVTDGFILHMHFTIDFSNQPPGQDENHHNILTMKRAAPSPWYGFQIRHSSTNKYIQLGTQFSGGNNVNTTIASAATASANTAEYNLTITYDPLASSNRFVCYDNITESNVYTSNMLFPDIPDLEYLKVMIGCAMDENGEPYRYSNINVSEFSLTKLSLALVPPVISCDGQEVTITCETIDSVIYYKLNQTGEYALYSTPIAISADTFVEAYSMFHNRTSEVVSMNCIHTITVDDPIIRCNGTAVTITCATADATIYYRINEEGNYDVYATPIEISADTIFESFASLSGVSSNTVSANCIYNPGHDYSHDYLTFEVISGGTIIWKAFCGVTKTISYSVDEGTTWTSITSTTAGTPITVAAGDRVLFKGTETRYCNADKTRYSGFDSSDTSGTTTSGSAIYNIQGNIMSLAYGDNFIEQTEIPSAWSFCSIFKYSKVVSAENLILPATTMKEACYRAMFSFATLLTAPPELPATTLARDCYWYMFEACPFTTAPELNATTLVQGCYGSMFINCHNVNYIKCLAKDISASACTFNWVNGVAGSGTFVEDTNTPWEIGTYNGIPSGWRIVEIGVKNPVISCDGENITISCDEPNADIYYRLNQTGTYTLYEESIAISADTVVEAYSELDSEVSDTVSATCTYEPGAQAPVIGCDGELVTITCATPGATIYYDLSQSGVFSAYTSAIPITADTLVEAYAERNGVMSELVALYCIYNPVHHYENDYLTFRVRSNGTINWAYSGSGYNKVISYSINDGAWTSITASTTGTPISVQTGDVVRLKGTNATYAGSKSAYAGFSGGTAYYDVEGNIMSLVYGDNFVGQTALTGTYNFCSLFKQSNAASAEHLILPTMTLTNYCYRAMFSFVESLTVAPALPATTLAQGCYWYMFEKSSITMAPELPATNLVRECYGNMFINCSSLNYIKCLAESNLTVTSATTNWVSGVASSGTFVKASGVTWSTGNSGIPRNWVQVNNGEDTLAAPVVSCDGEEVMITCETQGASIYYNVSEQRSYTLYTEPIPISANTIVQAYSTKGQLQSNVTSETCVYSPETMYEKSNKVLSSWTYNGVTVTTPYSVNRVDGHSSSYSKGTFNFETTVNLKATQPAYLWFQHADQSATIYVDNVLVEKHWGGYTAFFVDITTAATKGVHTIKVALKNNEGNNLAPAAGDFNFNATLGNVKLFSSPVLPDMDYGYDGFHITSTIASATSSATINVKTSIPTGATVTCSISDGTYSYGSSADSTGNEMVFSATVQDVHLWNGTLDPYLYTVTLNIYKDGELYHSYQRPYGFRFYEYVINDANIIVSGQPYTGFLLNGSPYYLRGVCMHDDKAGKANALTSADYAEEFAVIQELGCNFMRLAHYPHPKEVYDYCDQLGIIVQTEGPCVNKLQSTMPSAYYTHLETQYAEMVNQHYNHPSIVFWGLSNETTTDDAAFGNTKINAYTAQIKALDSERLVGYVMSHSTNDPLAYYNTPNVDWVGGNIYVGWYIDKASNNPTTQLNTRITNTITNKQKALAFSEYGAGGTQHCHSEDPQTTTTKGNYERHDIEYQMWLHEGHIAAIRNFPQLLFTAQWQLFDIAVSNRNEGYTICLDGENTSTDDDLRRLNNKGLVERDHVTKKDTFYIYKAEWSSQKFVHICGKDYTRKNDRVIKCYTNDENNNQLSLYVNGNFTETVNITNHIATFTANNYNTGDIIRVDGRTTSDTFTF